MSATRTESRLRWSFPHHRRRAPRRRPLLLPAPAEATPSMTATCIAKAGRARKRGWTQSAAPATSATATATSPPTRRSAAAPAMLLGRAAPCGTRRTLRRRKAAYAARWQGTAARRAGAACCLSLGGAPLAASCTSARLEGRPTSSSPRRISAVRDRSWSSSCAAARCSRMHVRCTHSICMCTACARHVHGMCTACARHAW